MILLAFFFGGPFISSKYTLFEKLPFLMFVVSMLSIETDFVTWLILYNMLAIIILKILQLDEETKTQLGTLQVNEYLSGNQKVKKMKDLEKKLKSHDYYFTYSDDTHVITQPRAWHAYTVQYYEQPM